MCSKLSSCGTVSLIIYLLIFYFNCFFQIADQEKRGKALKEEQKKVKDCLATSSKQVIKYVESSIYQSRDVLRRCSTVLRPSFLIVLLSRDLGNHNSPEISGKFGSAFSPEARDFIRHLGIGIRVETVEKIMTVIVGIYFYVRIRIKKNKPENPFQTMTWQY